MWFSADARARVLVLVRVRVRACVCTRVCDFSTICDLASVWRRRHVYPFPSSSRPYPLFPIRSQGVGDLGVLGHPTISSPNLDVLANSGVRFTAWYSGFHICSPSRAAMLTGKQRSPAFHLPSPTPTHPLPRQHPACRHGDETTRSPTTLLQPPCLSFPPAFPSPLHPPGHTALTLAGRLCIRSGTCGSSYTGGVFSNKPVGGLPQSETTFASQLKAVGYTTAAMGTYELRGGCVVRERVRVRGAECRERGGGERDVLEFF